VETETKYCTFLWGGPHDGFKYDPVYRGRPDIITVRPERLTCVKPFNPSVYADEPKRDRYIRMLFGGLYPEVWVCFVFEVQRDWFKEAIPRQMNALIGLIRGWRWA